MRYGAQYKRCRKEAQHLVEDVVKAIKDGKEPGGSAQLSRPNCHGPTVTAAIVTAQLSRSNCHGQLSSSNCHGWQMWLAPRCACLRHLMQAIHDQPQYDTMQMNNLSPSRRHLLSRQPVRS